MDNPLDMEDVNTKKKIGYLSSEINIYDMLVKEILNYLVSHYQKAVDVAG